MKQLNDIEHKRMIVEQLTERIKAEYTGGGLCRFELQMDAAYFLDRLYFLKWLDAQDGGIKTYFNSRDAGFEMAGFGVADSVVDDGAADVRELFSVVEKRVREAEGDIRYYGSSAFNFDAEVDEVWEKFGKFRFIVPEVELVLRGREIAVAFNVLASAEDDADSLIEKMLYAIDGVVFDTDESAKTTAMSVESRTDMPMREAWIKNVEDVVGDIEEGKLSKLVLARRTTLEMADMVNPFGLLRSMINVGFMNEFCFQVEDGNAFIGASPERLFRIADGQIYAEALAGTRTSDGKTIGLLESAKDVFEHKFVVDDVFSALNDLCENVEQVTDMMVVRLPNLEHLRSEFKGKLKEDFEAGDIIERMHPTSAVNGVPKEYAMQEIDRLEDFSRGMYAGAVGWIGKDKADFAVGIRSGVVKGDVIYLYAGAGIVESSDAAMEWDETEAKISRFMRAVGQQL